MSPGSDSRRERARRQHVRPSTPPPIRAKHQTSAHFSEARFAAAAGRERADSLSAQNPEPAAFVDPGIQRAWNEHASRETPRRETDSAGKVSARSLRTRRDEISWVQRRGWGWCRRFRLRETSTGARAGGSLVRRLSNAGVDTPSLYLRILLDAEPRYTVARFRISFFVFFFSFFFSATPVLVLPRFILLRFFFYFSWR